MSIRLRLTLWYVAMLAAILVAFAGGLYAVLSFNLLTEVDSTLQTRAEEIQNGIRPELELQRDAPVPLVHLTLPPANTFATPGIFVQVIRPDGSLVTQSANFPGQSLVVPNGIIARVVGGDSVLANINAGDVPLRVYVHPLTWQGRMVGIIEVAESLQEMNSTLGRLATLLATGIVGSLVIAFVVGALLARSALAPIENITRTAHGITQAGDLTRRIEHRGAKDEVGRLAATFNEMLARIEELFRVQQRFVADVSHELRSPLTAIQGNLDLLRRGAADIPEERQVALAAIDSESARMQRLVDDLLLLARADAGIQIQKQVVELDTLLLDVYRHARLTSSGVKIALGAEDQAQVLGDPDRLKQLFLNLMDNAIKYTPAGGEVTLSLERDTEWVRVSVADTGVGIPPQDLSRVFDRFYRVDKARSRGQGGTGLGLSIVKWIVDAHGGSIDVKSQVGKGSTFTVSLPLYKPGAVREDRASVASQIGNRVTG